MTQPTEDLSLPIRRVVLYQHGIGHFERSGPVAGRAVVRLRFKQDQMSDVLKSLTVLDHGGGRIEAIAYDSTKAPEQVLAEFAFDLRRDDVLQSLLVQLRGARVEVDAAGGDAVRGAVLGLDARVETRDGVEVRVPRLSVATDDGALVGVDLFDFRSLRFEDPALADELHRYLGVLRTTHRRDEKAVELVCDGDGEREVAISYAIEQPVWKATYRLVIPDDAATDARPFLQGWAVVDNTTEDDWTDVSLALVAGLPVSFRHDLYTPRHRVRPERPVDDDQAVTLDTLDGDDFDEKSTRHRDARAFAAPMAAGAVVMGDAAFEESVEPETVTREIGDLLEYRIDHPVTIPRNRSALLPIVAERVEGERIAVYREYERATNPLSAVRFENATGGTLEGGPATVLEGDAYAGEAMLAPLKAGERTIVPFAVELGVRATTDLDSRTERIHRVSVAHGTMIRHHREVDRKTYSFDNKSDRAKVVLIEHARRNGYALVEPTAPDETELDRYRFRVEVPARASAELVVREAIERRSGVAITNVDDATIAWLSEQGVLPDDARARLSRVVERKATIAGLEAAAAERRERLEALGADQERVRENLGALGGSAEEKDLRRTYVERLAADEERVGALRSELEDLTTQVRDARRALDDEVQTLALE